MFTIMEKAECIKVLRALINGIHPETGEDLPVDSPCNQPQVIRALMFALEQFFAPKTAREKKTVEQKRAENERLGRPKNAGLPWTEDAREVLSIGFKNGRMIHEVARDLDRSHSAVVAELKRQGLISEDEAMRLR